MARSFAVMRSMALHLFGVIASSILLGSSLVAQSPAATPGVRLEISPGTIQLGPGEARAVRIVLRNPTASSLQNLQFRWSTVTDVKVSGALPNVAQLSAGETLGFPVTITQTASGLASGTVYFELSYNRRSADHPTPVPDLAIGSMEIQEPPAEPVDKIATMRIETETAELDDHHDGLVFLIVTNIATVPVRVTGIGSHHPKFIEVVLPRPTRADVLKPQTTRVFAIPVSVKNDAPSGKQRLIFDVAVEWVKSGRSGSGTLIAAHTAHVGVFGESQLLQLVGVPSLLFLPGFLMLSSFLLLWVRVAPARAQTLSTAEFTLISITLSLIGALLYPVITSGLGERRDYLRGYGLQDIFQVWFGSVALGVGSWLVMTAFVALRRRARDSSERRARAHEEEVLQSRTPNATDTPLSLLDKLIINGLGFPLRQVDVTRSGNKPRCFLVTNATDSPTWVIPAIQIRMKGRDADAWIEKLEQAGTESPAALRQVLREAADFADAGWSTDGAIKRPTQVAAGEWTLVENAGPRALVEIA